MPSITQLADVVKLTRNTELAKGSWTSLQYSLPGYLYTEAVIPRKTLRSSSKVEWPIGVAGPSSAEYTSVNDPLTVSVPDLAKKARVTLAKVRNAVSWSVDEEELQGGSDEQIVSVVAMRKSQFDMEMVEFIERALAQKPASSSTSPQQIYGLPYWFPHKASATDLELNGGEDPSGFALGAGELTVSDEPRWAHAVAGFSKLSDDDLFAKLSEFMHRAKYLAPQGASTIDPSTPNRIVLVQHQVFTAWEKLQVAGNENFRSDVGMWRGAINFRSIPVRIWHVISEPDSPQKPDSYGILYALDLNTLKWLVHSAFDFKLSDPVMDPNVPGQVKMWRQAYCQLLCTNRERNLTMHTTNADLY